jgi:class 3 adenylate cyclase
MEPNDRLKRKLVAILHVDIVCFSRLSYEDEEGTYRKLCSHLDYFAETIQSHNGSVVNTADYAILAEFPTGKRGAQLRDGGVAGVTR